MTESDNPLSPAVPAPAPLTLATPWSVLTGQPLDDALLSWAPDVVALTTVVLERVEGSGRPGCLETSHWCPRQDSNLRPTA